MVSENPKSILIAGESGSGKTTSLMKWLIEKIYFILIVKWETCSF